MVVLSPSLRTKVRKLHAFVKDKHPTAVCLESVVISKTVVERLEAVADGAVAEASWFEVSEKLNAEVGGHSRG